MRSLGNMPRIVIISEVLGLLLLVVAYLSINNYLSLPGEMGTPTAAIMMIFVGIGLMIPAAVCIVWRLASGFGPLLGSADRISTPQKVSEEKLAAKSKKSGQDNH